jgi:hypothetical protein
MKKIVLSALLAVGFMSANAQRIEAGVHGGFGTTWFLNNNVSDQGDDLDYKASFGPVFGLHGGYILPSNFGVVVDVDFAMNQQKYKGKQTGGTFVLTEKVNYVEVPILLRKYTKSGFYFEVGPKFSFLGSIKETAESSPTTLFDYKDKKIGGGFSKTIVSAAFGIGGQFEVASNLYAEVGLRFAYGFNDATKKYTEAEINAAFLTGDIGMTDMYAHQDQAGNYSYQSTHLATGHVIAGLTYRIPMAKKTASGKK